MIYDHMNSSFKWFVGVVENCSDPEEIGRVKVRCYGVHPLDEVKCPTDDLPWATVMSPTTHANLRGLRSEVHGLAVGSTVVGFFLDGESAQSPLVIGSIAGKAPSKPPNPDSSYANPAQTENFIPGELDLGVLATSKDVESIHPMVRSMAASRVTNVNCASIPNLDKVDGTGFPDQYFEQPKWSQPEGRNGSTIGDFPNTRTYESSAGHVIEVDDSPENARLLWYHGDGTYQEFLPGGNRVAKVVGNNYEVVFGSNNILIKGNANLTVEGDLRQLVVGNYNLEVYKDYTVKVHGSKKTKISGNDLKEVFGYEAIVINADKQLTVNGKVRDVVAGGIKQTVSSDYDITVGGLAPVYSVQAGTLPGLGLIQFTSTGQIDSIATTGIGIKSAITTIGDPTTITNIVGSAIGITTAGAIGIGAGLAIAIGAGGSITAAAPAINLN